MKKLFYTTMCVLVACLLYSCQRDAGGAGNPFDPTQPMVVTTFFPDSGGIATPMLISGSNFGSDTVGLNVYFVYQGELDAGGVERRFRAGLVSVNPTGEHIYAFVPRLTHMRDFRIEIVREHNGVLHRHEEATPQPIFQYITQTAVSTVAGVPRAGGGQFNTVPGPMASATFSSPVALIVDDEDNIVVVERRIRTQRGGWWSAYTRQADGAGRNSILLFVDQTMGEVRQLQSGFRNYLNAPAFANIIGHESINVPADHARYPRFYQLPRIMGYAPRAMTLDRADGSPLRIALDMGQGSWLYSFVFNNYNNMIYSVMWNGNLFRFDPQTQESEVLARNVLPRVAGGVSPMANTRGEAGSNVWLAFHPVRPNELWMAQEDFNLIAYIDVSAENLAALGEVREVDPDTGEVIYSHDIGQIVPTFFAGRSIDEGPNPGRGFEDGLLRTARFFAPRQIAFTNDGRLFIADTDNHVIRGIDTGAENKVDPETAVVTTIIGIPEESGFRDGGPELARFNRPTGVSPSADGQRIYVVDNANAVVRVLSTQ